MLQLVALSRVYHSRIFVAECEAVCEIEPLALLPEVVRVVHFIERDRVEDG